MPDTAPRPDLWPDDDPGAELGAVFHPDPGDSPELRAARAVVAQFSEAERDARLANIRPVIFGPRVPRGLRAGETPTPEALLASWREEDRRWRAFLGELAELRCDLGLPPLDPTPRPTPSWREEEDGWLLLQVLLERAEAEPEGSPAPIDP